MHAAARWPTARSASAVRICAIAASTGHVPLAELEASLEQIRQSPHERGVVELVVARPAVDERALLTEARLESGAGLVGDRWRSGARGVDLSTQLTLMNARVAACVAGDPERWGLAGDQLYVDLDLSGENLPPGTRLRVGEAVIEISDVPHTGCGKFIARFGVDAQRFVNSPVGRALNLRGVNASIIVGGSVRAGDPIEKLTG